MWMRGRPKYDAIANAVSDPGLVPVNICNRNPTALE